MASQESKQLNHLGLILDGNRRWATAQGLPGMAGHRQGFENLKKILTEIKSMNIPFVTVYAFSTENWSRAEDEVKGLMSIFRIMLKKDLAEIMKSERKILFLGDRDRMPKDLQRLMDNAEEKTKGFLKGTLGICMSYGGQEEIVQAAKKAVAAGEELSEQTISKYLYAPELPPLDLIIRTSGEQRLSNFMLWRASYAELAFSQTYWPDFSVAELHQIVDDYMSRSRRFGS